MMLMMVATVLVMVSLIMFTLWYTQRTLSTTEHRSSIDSAALAAATAVGRIVVQTPEFGYVSMTGFGPTGTTTKAPDNYFQRVHSINELMATARLDMIIASELGDPLLTALAKQDRANVIKAKDRLIAEIEKAIVKGGFGRDADGNIVRPYEEAEAIYQGNPTLASSYVKDSMVIKLGGVVDGVPTAVSIPSPSGKASVGGADQVNGHYRSDRNIPFGGQSFVFASVGNQPSLVDHRKFAETVPSLPFQMPAAVQVFAKQRFKDGSTNYTVTPFTAVATAGGAYAGTAGGALMISMPDGAIVEFTNLKALYTYGETRSTKVECLSAINGDYPSQITSKGAVLGPLPQPVPWVAGPTAADAALVAIYDWIRHAGSRANIDSVVSAVNRPLNKPSPPMVNWVSEDKDGKWLNIGMIPNGIQHIFEFDNNGNIGYKSKPMSSPSPYYDVAQNQFYAEGFGITSATKDFPRMTVALTDTSKGWTLPQPHDIWSEDDWDIYVRDYVRTLGPAGGQHVGEPMNTNRIVRLMQPTDLAWQNDFGAGSCGAWKWGGGGGSPPLVSDQTDFVLKSTPTKPPPIYPEYESYKWGPSAGAPQPTYNTNGLCAEIRYRRQLDIEDLELAIGGVGYRGLVR
jgi:hypothetical protein